MTPDARRELSATIRSLRDRLLDDLHAATASAYRLTVRARDAGLDDAARKRRSRVEAWVAEQLRAQAAGAEVGKGVRVAEDFRREAEKQAAYTLLNRLVVLRLMEAPGPSGEPLRAPTVVTGGWESTAYGNFRQIALALVQGDESEGFAFLLQLVFEDLAAELPGIYGSAGVADLVPVPAATLRHVVEQLDKPELESCWADDMTLGWVYQYWNDPEREAIDKKLHTGSKLQPHEIASKTQLFTERYIVDWLLQNTIGPMWLAMCRKRGWVPDVEADGTLQRLEERRTDWRAKRDAGTVSLSELMPLHTDAERRWVYYLPQPIPDDAVAQAPRSVRYLKLLDPAVGSGHFLVVAMDLLAALYREEARHRGEAGRSEWSERAIVECILANNLHGIDLDPRAVQIAAAALWLKARQLAPDIRPERLNLVASNLRLASLPNDDPALAELRLEVERETGIPGTLADTIVHSLRGADYLGSLLKVDRAVDMAIEVHEQTVCLRLEPQQGDVFEAPQVEQRHAAFEAAAARRSLLDRLEKFLERHTSGDDLGLRLHGEQLAAGVRFVRMVREGTYDLVVANPPYQGTSKMAESDYIDTHYPLGRADLYAAFLLRGLELARPGGVSSMLTMRNWMFIKQFATRRVKGVVVDGLREHLLGTFDLRAVGDFDRGAFEDVADEVVSVAVSVFRNARHTSESVALCPTPREDRARDKTRTQRKRAATQCHVGRHEFEPAAVRVIPEWPLVYWWRDSDLSSFASAPKVGESCPVKVGLQTSDNTRFLRLPWEPRVSSVFLQRATPPFRPWLRYWIPLVKGASGRTWFEPVSWLVNWRHCGLEVQSFSGSYTRNPEFYFTLGVAFTTMGFDFSARLHRFLGIFGDKGRSVFPDNRAAVLASMNSGYSREVMSALNPTQDFNVGDVERLPLADVACAGEIVAQLEVCFTEHESHREPSVEFRRPGPSVWRSAQKWAQAAVDRAAGAPLPTYTPEVDQEPAVHHLSFAFGVVLGRFHANGEGVVQSTANALSHAIPAGILFLDRTLDGDDRRDSLGHPAADTLHQAWATYGGRIGSARAGLREWLALDAFKDVHRAMYENRPIYWPLSSAQKTFVAWVNIHRLNEQTLRVLLADYLYPTVGRIEGELDDLRAARAGVDQGAARRAERQYDRVVIAKNELEAFIADVEQCSDRGAPPVDAKGPPRSQDARYIPDLDDGVMINSAALWPLLEPQWKDPKKWWRELSEAKGKKDYDWSHLAMRYWPTRVDAKCQTDPSLGVAHGCFWRYHAARAWAWELRLQDEIGPDFRIEEAPYRPGGRDVGDEGSDAHRDAWLFDHPKAALAAVKTEAVRRMRRGKNRASGPYMRILEAGLWSAIPDDVWDMELDLAERQGADFRLIAPDEPVARAAYEAAHPERTKARAELIATLVRPDEWFGEPGDADEEDVVADPLGDDDEDDGEEGES